MAQKTLHTTTSSPSSIDTKILYQQLLRRTWSEELDKLELWGIVVDLDENDFRDQQNGVMKFRGIIQTNGVGIFIIKQNQGTTQEPCSRRTTTINPEDIPYSHDLSPEQHERIRGRCSTAETPRCYRYTSNQQNIRLKRTKFRHILQDVKAQAPNVIAVELEISQTSGQANNTANFAFHTSVEEANFSIFSSFYTNTLSHTSKRPLFCKLPLASYINQHKSNKRLAKIVSLLWKTDTVGSAANRPFEPSSKFSALVHIVAPKCQL
ncbi:hypothetical protein J3Q64DRAFT_1882119 [Phycomyces blakesleeanus]|uniref:Uncharacterized protein n=1 Tax=Phycomyces blakesleeanus TaxID=4837 RepID=A0ABR3B362_PHYBL